MKSLIAYIDKNWGKPQLCSACYSSTPSFVCGGVNCAGVAYCNETCQTTHWSKHHQYVCVAGGTDGKKRGRDEYELEELNIEDINKDVWSRILYFLNARDIKNLNLTERIIQQNIRAAFFRRFRFVITEDVLNHPYFKQIVNSVGSVKVDSIEDLNRVIALKSKNKEGVIPIYDVKFSNDFNEPVNGRLPETLTHLTFGLDFDQPIDNLPSNLTHLVLEFTYSRPINKFPPNLKHLTIDKSYTYDDIRTLSLENLPKGVQITWTNEIESLL